jgi:hypothetical protein
MEIRPEKGLGPFLIGTSIYEVLHMPLTAQFGKCVTRYHATDPISMHIILDLEERGFYCFLTVLTFRHSTLF